MYGFLLKKNFCDGWDNMLNLMIPNVINLVIITGTVYFTHAVVSAEILYPTVFMWLIVIAGSSLVTFVNMSFCENAELIANFGPPSLKAYFTNMGKNFKDGILFGLLQSVIVVLGIIGIPFYLKIGRAHV